MAEDQFDRLTPGQVTATLRSLPRRIRETLGADPTVDVAAHASTPGPGGRSVAQILVDIAGAVRTLDDVVHQVVVHDRPAIVAAPPAGHPGAAGLGTHIDQVTAAVEGAASRFDRIAPRDWLRVGIAPDGREIDAQTLAREAARRAIAGLRELETVVAALPRS